MRVTTQAIQAMKTRGERIPMLTAYDFPTAKLVEAAGIPFILVGDSLGMVVLGYETTLQVTMEDMIRHTQAVVRGTKKALVVADLPFMSYHVSAEQAVANAGRLMKEGGAGAVKLEGGRVQAATIRRIVDTGIPVMGHVGLTPQAVHALGGFKVQGKSVEAARRLVDDALAVEESGAFSIVLEGIPSQLARHITQRLRIPTIGIGAGVHCDGQVQVLHDVLGLFPDFVPKHARQYVQVGEQVQQMAARYIADVTAGTFPGDEQSVNVDPSVLRALEEPASVPA